MTPERWRQVTDIFHASLTREASSRPRYLDEACGGDPALRAEIEAMLAAHAAGAQFGDTPVQVSAVHSPRLATGAMIGAHRVEQLIGSGGMGEVYRARDTRLGRDVAIKVLPTVFTADPDRLARFEREARLLAALNHPHIAAIYGLEETSEVHALVLELVEGDTLADRVAKGPVPVKHALDVARQIAEALEAAHEKGIIHRDLKPANIKVTADGTVKVLDFGLAKAFVGDAAVSQVPTVTVDRTHEGAVAGTPAYMSPEQTRGHTVDKRTDIWAYGCVLYELLTGRAAFARDTITDTLAAILERTPDWAAVPAATPRPVRRLLRRCLDKDLKQRLRDIGDARIELEQLEADNEDAGIQPARTPRRQVPAVVAATVVPLVLTGALWLWLSREAPPSDVRVSRFTVTLAEDQVIAHGFNSPLALSPDGTYLAYTPIPGPVVIRRLDTLEAAPLESTVSDDFRGAPMFSPDGASIAFIQGNAIISSARPFFKAALSGGAAVKLADYDMFHRGDWGADGYIYWTAQYPGGIVRIAEAGGPIEPVTELDLERGERSHRFARLLPGGEALIYTVASDGVESYDDARIDLMDLRTRERKTLVAGGMSAVYSPSGHIVYARAGKLLAVPFDLRRREVTGSPFEVADNVMMSRNTGAAYFTISRRGDLAYVPGPAEGGRRTLVWVDRSGKAEPLPLPPASYLYPRISPDGRSLAVEIEGPNHDFYLYDFARGVLSKVTTDGLSHDPVWTPDGRRLAFRSWQAGGMTMWLMPADRSGSPVRLDRTGTRQSPVSFSPDGKFLLFDQKDPETQDDVWVLPLAGTPQPFVRSRFGEGSAKFSPDGRWVAYSSDESGDAEVYVQSFPGPGPKVQISSDGGTDPVWRRSGGELYYRSGTRMMVVSVTTAPELRVSAPTLLWDGDYSEGSGASCGMPGVSSSNYDVTPDGQRFLMVRDEDTPGGNWDGLAARQIVVVLNWAEELKRLVPR